jgi:hypothetical protein
MPIICGICPGNIPVFGAIPTEPLFWSLFWFGIIVANWPFGLRKLGIEEFFSEFASIGGGNMSGLSYFFPL